MKATVGSGKEFKQANLSVNVHPAVLVGVSQESIPDGWEMGKKHSHMWRWHFVAWEDAQAAQSGTTPEELEPISSPVISPPTRFQASKAYLFLKGLLGTDLDNGAVLDFDTLFPRPCRIMTHNDTKDDRVVCILDHIVPAEDWQKLIQPHPRIAELRLEIATINAQFEANRAAAIPPQQPAPPAQTAIPLPPTPGDDLPPF